MCPSVAICRFSSLYSDADDLSSSSSIDDSTCSLTTSLLEVTEMSCSESDSDDDESISDVSCCTVYQLTETDHYVVVDMLPKH